MRNSEDGWNQCCKGEVARLVGTLQQTQHRHLTRRRIIVGVAGLVLLAGFFLVRGGVGSVDAAANPMSCREVHRHTDDFVAGKLDQTLTARVEAHLEHCRGCVRHVDQVRDNAGMVNTKSDEVSVASL